MHTLPVPRHPLLRPLPTPLSLRMGERRRQSRAGRRYCYLWEQRWLAGGRVRQEGRASEERSTMRDEFERLDMDMDIGSPNPLPYDISASRFRHWASWAFGV